ncbi:hypothetical protein [Sphingomonas sp. PP-CE-1G-424]|uniref:hypothetical protein n=1 Tax=Sphingomonas sp. PP-CE-1G-424 TaxID=2135658 RepID=UPI0010552039|nr:hypothetical protein [Sphingomonas sp. PP-CE-1G-424]
MFLNGVVQIGYANSPRASLVPPDWHEFSAAIQIPLDQPAANVGNRSLMARPVGAGETELRTLTPLPSLPNFGRWFIFAKTDFEARLSARECRDGEESGQAAFGKAGGNSRHWAAAGFPKKDRIFGNGRVWVVTANDRN